MLEKGRSTKHFDEDVMEDVTSFKNSLFREIIIVLSSFVDMNSVVNSWTNGKGELRDKFNPWLISHLHTAGQSQLDMGANVRLKVMEMVGYTDLIQCQKGVVGFRSYPTIWQAPQREYKASPSHNPFA